MKQFLPEELVQFVQKVDELLTKDCDLIIIGGGRSIRPDKRGVIAADLPPILHA